MAKLPSADSLGARPIPQASGEILTFDGGQVARATRSFADKAFNVATNELERRDKLAYAGAKSALVQREIEVRKSLEDDPDYTTYEPRYNEAMKGVRKEVSESLGANFFKGTFDIDATEVETNGRLRVLDMAKARETDRGIATLNEMIESNRSAALSADDEMTRTALIDATNAAIDGAMAKGYLTETKAGEVRRGFAESYAEGSLDLMTPVARVRALQNVGEGSPLYLIQPDRRARLLEQARNEVERQGAVYRARVSETFQSDLAYLNSGGDPSKVRVNRQELVTAFGPEKGTAYADRLDRSVMFSDDLRTLSNASPEQISATLNELKPTDPENFQEGSARYNAYVSALNARNKILSTDPVSYLAQNIPDVSVALESASSGDGSWDNLVAPLDASYEQLGVPKGARHVLPAQSAKALVTRIMENDGADISANLDTLQASMSPSTWNRVYGDLVSLGELPVGAQVVAEVSPANATAKAAIGQALKLGKDLDKLVETEDRKTIEDSVPGALEEFRISLQGSGSAGQRAYLARADAVTALAKTYLANGTSPSASDAVEKAATDIVGWAYDFSSEGWRVPKSASGESRLSDIEATADSISSGIKPGDVGIFPADAELVRVLGEDEVQRQYVSQPKVWRNTANDEGLQLFYEGSGLPVLDREGNPVTLGFDEVEPGAVEKLRPPRFGGPNAPIDLRR